MLKNEEFALTEKKFHENSNLCLGTKCVDFTEFLLEMVEVNS